MALVIEVDQMGGVRWRVDGLAAELPAGRIDSIAFALTEFDHDSGRFEDLAEPGDGVCVGCGVGESGDRVVGDHIQNRSSVFQ